MNVATDIGPELVMLRRALGLSQADLAARIGVKRQQIQRWESCEYRVASLERVGKVADALGWSAWSAPIAAESLAAYGRGAARPPGGPSPARDLGDVVARIRKEGASLKERFGVRSMAIFGSFARGDQTPASDVDVLMEMDSPTLESQFGAERELERILGRRVETGTPDSVNPRVRSAVDAEAVRVWSA